MQSSSDSNYMAARDSSDGAPKSTEKAKAQASVLKSVAAITKKKS